MNLARIDLSTGEMKILYSQPQSSQASALVTGGDLVFWGDANRRVRAFDGDSGKVLWEPVVGGIVMTGTITYAVDGKQYVAILTGDGQSVTAGPLGLTKKAMATPVPRPQLGRGVRAAGEVTLRAGRKLGLLSLPAFTIGAGRGGGPGTRFLLRQRVPKSTRKKHAEPGCHQRAAAFEQRLPDVRDIVDYAAASASSPASTAPTGTSRSVVLAEMFAHSNPGRSPAVCSIGSRAIRRACAIVSGLHNPTRRVAFSLASQQRRSDHDREDVSRPDAERFQLDPAGSAVISGHPGERRPRRCRRSVQVSGADDPREARRPLHRHLLRRIVQDPDTGWVNLGTWRRWRAAAGTRECGFAGQHRPPDPRRSSSSQGRAIPGARSAAASIPCCSSRRSRDDARHHRYGLCRRTTAAPYGRSPAALRPPMPANAGSSGGRASSTTRPARKSSFRRAHRLSTPAMWASEPVVRVQPLLPQRSDPHHGVTDAAPTDRVVRRVHRAVRHRSSDEVRERGTLRREGRVVSQRPAPVRMFIGCR